MSNAIDSQVAALETMLEVERMRYSELKKRLVELMGELVVSEETRERWFLSNGQAAEEKKRLEAYVRDLESEKKQLEAHVKKLESENEELSGGAGHRS